MNLRDQFRADVKAVCLNPEDFGDRAVYTPRAGAAVNLNGIYRENFKENSLFAEAVVNGETVFICSLEDIAEAKAGDQLSIPARALRFYVLRGNGKSMSGKMILVLSENNPL